MRSRSKVCYLQVREAQKCPVTYIMASVCVIKYLCITCLFFCPTQRVNTADQTGCAVVLSSQGEAREAQRFVSAESKQLRSRIFAFKEAQWWDAGYRVWCSSGDPGGFWATVMHSLIWWENKGATTTVIGFAGDPMWTLRKRCLNLDCNGDFLAHMELKSEIALQGRALSFFFFDEWFVLKKKKQITKP